MPLNILFKVRFTHVRLRPAQPKQFPDADHGSLLATPCHRARHRFANRESWYFWHPAGNSVLDLADTLSLTLRQVPAFPNRISKPPESRADQVHRLVPHATPGFARQVQACHLKQQCGVLPSETR